MWSENFHVSQSLFGGFRRPLFPVRVRRYSVKVVQTRETGVVLLGQVVRYSIVVSGVAGGRQVVVSTNDPGALISMDLHRE